MATPSDPQRQPGRLRLAAALGGAGVLAVGLGAGVLQSAAQDPATPGAPGEDVLGTQEPTSVAPAAEESRASGESAATTETETSTTAATVTGTGDAPAAAEARSAPASAQPAAEQAATPAPAAETPAAPAQAAQATPAAEAPAAAPAAPAAPAAQDPTKQAEKPAAEVCEDDEEETLTLQGGEAVECAPERKPAKKKKKKRSAKKVDEDAADPSVDQRPAPAPPRNADGVPTMANPTTSLALPGAAPIGVPNFFIDKFRIPPFLLPIYQAAGTEYGIRWEILAAINEIETDYGRNLNVSSAGALGWMQFMPATWKQYGTDANGDGRKDPFNPVDAIFAAARYLKAAGADKDISRAIFAYNRADWYVDSVLMRARIVGGLPTDLVGSLTGLTQGRFPVAAKARYADDLEEQRKARKAGVQKTVDDRESQTRRGILIFAGEGSPAIATHDGKIVKRGKSARLGRYVQVRDTLGNTYTYARLKSLEATHPVPKRGAKPSFTEPVAADDVPVEPKAGNPELADGPASSKERLFANPVRPKAYKAGGSNQVGAPVPQGREAYVKDLLGLKPKQVTWKELKPGSTVVAGTVLGRLGKTSSTRAPHLLFEIRPAGRGAPRIDPKPILDGWKLLETTAIYRARRKNPFFGKDAKAPTIGQILLMSKESLQSRVLRNPNITSYGVGREQIRAGLVDRRILAVLEFLAANGLDPGVSSLFRPGSITSSGRLSHHATGTAVDIPSINGQPIIGNQGEGSITDITIRRLLTLQGAMKPDQIISLMQYPGTSNTLALPDHNDHIHVGFRPVSGRGGRGSALNAVLKPGQWLKVVDRLNEIQNPVVRQRPSKASIKVTPKRRGNVPRRWQRPN